MINNTEGEEKNKKDYTDTSATKILKTIERGIRKRGRKKNWGKKGMGGQDPP